MHFIVLFSAVVKVTGDMGSLRGFILHRSNNLVEIQLMDDPVSIKAGIDFDLMLIGTNPSAVNVVDIMVECSC